MGGCEWDEKTGDVISYLQCGYNGEDLMIFDMKNMTWIPQNPLAVILKPLWSRDKAILKSYQAFFQQICPDLLKKLMAFAPRKRTGKENTSGAFHDADFDFVMI